MQSILHLFVSINSHIRILLTPIGIFMLLSERYRTTKDERRGSFANPSYYDAENDEDVTGWRANELNTRSMYKQDRRVLKNSAERNGIIDISKVRYGSIYDAMMNRRAALITDLMNDLELATNHFSNYIQIKYSSVSSRIYFYYNFRLNALDGKIKKAVLAAFHDFIDVSSAFPEYVQAFDAQPKLQIFAGSDESRFILEVRSIEDTDVDLTVPREIRKQFLLDKAKEVAAILPEREIVRRLSTMLNNMIKAAMSRSDNVTKRS